MNGDLGSAVVGPPAGVVFEGEWPWCSEVPINELPGEVGRHIRLGSAPGVVVYMTSILAYSTVISFDVVRFSNGDDVRDAESPWGDLRFWVMYADGSEGRNDQGWGEDAVDPPGPVVLSWQSSSGQQSSYVLWPLPPPGAVTVRCESRVMAKTTVTFDAALLLDAAAHSQRLWECA
jgi:hypothetical protein